MAVSVEVPNLGEEMAGGVVAEWYLADGAEVAVGEPVCRIECAFVAVELEATGPGILRHNKPAGSIERPGAVLGLILAPGDPVPQPQPERAPEGSHPGAEVAPPTDPTADYSHEAQSDQDPGDPAIEQPEAVVVPFPRRFAPRRESNWELSPGNAVEFDSSLFEPGEPAEMLPEPGGSIPGLPLWEPDDEFAVADADAAADEPTERLAGIAAEVGVSAQALTMSLNVDLRECTRMLAVCAREWRPLGATPLLEDLVVRAITKAALEASLPVASAGLVIVGSESDAWAAVADPGARPLREAVAARTAGGDTAFESADWVLTSLSALGIASATPHLPDGHSMAFAVGATRDGVSTLTIGYDTLRLDQGSAARLLARARDILEAPYAMLV